MVRIGWVQEILSDQEIALPLLVNNREKKFSETKLLWLHIEILREINILCYWAKKLNKHESLEFQN